ncbi:MAG: hypothetical protein EPO32_14860 [Anaerolineae bacterium]|nr:MAG: hypothetical protein EPO32_14860 [Anaerolineae bacterium]
MDTLSAAARGMAAQGQTHRVFDWDEAARRIVASNPREAGAGLSEDWEYTGGTIYRDGAPVPADYTYVYLSSNWAAPQLQIDGDIEECWIWDKPESNPHKWDAHTYWPDSALAILREAGLAK